MINWVQTFFILTSARFLQVRQNQAFQAKRFVLKLSGKFSDKMADIKLMDVDGNMTEGGGQILRIATSLSSIFQIPVRIYDIRGGRKSPGLKAQHLNGVRLLRDMTEASLHGDELNSQIIEFIPNKLKDGSFKVEIGTAGAVVLLVQSSLPCSLFSSGSCNFHFTGGTNVDFAPPVDYNIQVLFPILKKFGIEIDYKLERRGYFPKGGGKFSYQTEPVKQLKAVNLLQFGNIIRCTVHAYVAGVLPIKIARQMGETARKLLEKSNLMNVECKIVKEENSFGNGSGIFIVVETSTGCLLSGSALGRRGLPADKVAQNAVNQLLESVHQQACVDQHTQDQLIIFMALAAGKSSIRSGAPTEHTRTAITLVEQLTQAKFSVTNNNDDGTCIIECDGTGYSNKHL